MRFAAGHKWMGCCLLASAWLAGECHAAPPCAATIKDLKVLLADQALPLQWHETTMDDGKPLVLTILERDGSLFLEFVKTDNGLWAEGTSVVCVNGADLEARFTGERFRFGKAAGWAMRQAFANGGRFTLTKLKDEHLRIATTGWSGTFSSRERE